MALAPYMIENILFLLIDDKNIPSSIDTLMYDVLYRK